MRLILRWIANAVALAVTIYILHLLGLAKWTGGKGAAGAVTALIAVLIMAIVNALIRPIVTMFDPAPLLRDLWPVRVRHQRGDVLAGRRAVRGVRFLITRARPARRLRSHEHRQRHRQPIGGLAS